MANYNIVVKSIKRIDQINFSGTFSLTDNDLLVEVDGRLNKAQATVHSGITSITYEGTPRPKINGTIGMATRDVMVDAVVNGETVKVQWTAGHRSSVSAAFMAVWNEVGGKLGVGDEIEVNKQNPKGSGRGSSGSAVSAPAVNNDKISELEKMLKAQAEQMQMLMDMLAKQNS